VNLFGWLRTAKPHLDATQQQRLAQLPQPVALGDAALRSQRWVVLDLETSGLNLNRDQVLSIGAVVIEDGAVDFSQMFERTLQRAETKLSPSVLIHGLGPARSPPAVTRWTRCWISWSSSATARCWPSMRGSINTCWPGRSRTAWVIAWPIPSSTWPTIAPLLYPEALLREAGLDDWIDHFHLQVGERHHASADALATAELMLILLSRARQQHIDTPRALQARLSQWKRRKQAPSF